MSLLFYRSPDIRTHRHLLYHHSDYRVPDDTHSKNYDNFFKYASAVYIHLNSWQVNRILNFFNVGTYIIPGGKKEYQLLHLFQCN